VIDFDAEQIEREREEHDFGDRAHDERDDGDAEEVACLVDGKPPEVVPSASVRPPVRDGDQTVVDVPDGRPDRVQHERVHQKRHRRPHVVHGYHDVLREREVHEVGVKVEHGVRGVLDEHGHAQPRRRVPEERHQRRWRVGDGGSVQCVQHVRKRSLVALPSDQHHRRRQQVRVHLGHVHHRCDVPYERHPLLHHGRHVIVPVRAVQQVDQEDQRVHHGGRRVVRLQTQSEKPADVHRQVQPSSQRCHLRRVHCHRRRRIGCYLFNFFFLYIYDF